MIFVTPAYEQRRIDVQPCSAFPLNYDAVRDP